MKKFAIVPLMLLASTALSTPAASADIYGGNCCQDLEERVAELEATTARKGNTKVSLKISGQVNQALLFWDDNFDSDTYIVDNNVSGSRLKFSGSGRINPELSAGFYIELDYRQTRSNKTSQTEADGGSLLTGGDTDVSDLMWYIKSEHLGRLLIGRYDEASDNIGNISLGGIDAVTDSGFNDWIDGFSLRLKDGGGLILIPDGGKHHSKRPVTWGDIFTGQVGEGDERQVVRYDSPAIAGFSLAGSWSSEDRWTAALRYAGEWGKQLRVAGGVGFGRQDLAATTDVDELGASLSLLHIPTGLFITGSYGEQDSGATSTEKAYYGQFGFNKKIFGVGATRLYGEYYRSEGRFSELSHVKFDGEYLRYADATTGVNGWGAGIVQAFDGAALELYLAWRHYEVDQFDVFVGENEQFEVGSSDIADIDVVMTGARIKF